jgi:hypothetical protein
MMCVMRKNMKFVFFILEERDPELDPDPGPDPLVIEVRIRTKISRIPNTEKKTTHLSSGDSSQSRIWAWTCAWAARPLTTWGRARLRRANSRSF